MVVFCGGLKVGSLGMKSKAVYFFVYEDDTPETFSKMIKFLLYRSRFWEKVKLKRNTYFRV